MIAATISAELIWLLTPPPAESLRVGLSMAVTATRSLGGATTRRPDHLLPRWSMEWAAQVDRVEFARMRAASRIAQNERVGVPFWLFARPASAAPLTSGGHTIAWTVGWGSWAIDPPSAAGFDFVAPLLIGSLASVRLKTEADDHVVADLSFDEDSDAGEAVSIAAGVLAADALFATAGGWSAPVFPFVADPTLAAAPGWHQVAVDRESVGPGRRKVQVFYPQIPEETKKAGFRLIGAEAAAQLLAWWIRRQGTAEAHWTAGTQIAGRLAATAAAGAATLQLDTAASLAGDTYLALFDGSGAIECVRIASAAGAVLTLAAPLGRTWSADATLVTPAFLARHTDRELALECVQHADGWLASASLSWREVAAEYAPAAGETRGVTIGKLPPRAYFFEWSLDFAGAVQTWRLTNWESGATAGGHVWTYNASSFDKLVRSIDLEDDTCTITARYFEGGPWDNWMPGALWARGFFTLYRADFEGGTFGALTQIFRGELGRPEFDAPMVRQKVAGANALMGRDTPRQLQMKGCGTNIFRPRCGLAVGDWTFNATVAAAAGNSVTIGTITRANGSALPSGFGVANWFALGWLGWTVAGATHRAGVLASTALASGQIVLTLAKAPVLTVGAAVAAVPGCDRYGPTCREKFANYPNFRGYEQTPATSPSLKLPNSTSSAAKK